MERTPASPSGTAAPPDGRDQRAAPGRSDGAAPAAAPTWHTLTADQALEAQGVDPALGLSDAEAAARLTRFGANKLTAGKAEPKWRAFLRQYRDPMQIVLLVAGAISLFLPGQLATGILLILLTLFNAALGLNQEGKASASVAALQKMLIVKARVSRGGRMAEVDSGDLVPGDVVSLEAGDLVPADGRLIRAAALEIDESALTGESTPVPKGIDVVPEVETPLGDRTDMAYMNSAVTRGAGRLLVTTTGMGTEVGRISGMLQAQTEGESPLTRQLNRLTSQILIIAGVALVISIGLGLARGNKFSTLFLTAVAFAVAAIPTGLPAVVTTVLAKGTSTLADMGAIMKRLRSVETLGSTTAINSDKTGTLTLNQMTAVQMAIVGRRYAVTGQGYATAGQINHVGGRPPVSLEEFLLPMALASDAEVRDGKLVGDPTEGALVVLAAKGGVDAVETRREYPRIAQVPFDAAYKLMATYHRMRDDQGREVVRAFVKGAPDQLLARATTARDPDGREVPVDQAARSVYLDANQALGKDGLRVMATARQDFDPATFDPGADLLGQLNRLTLLALIGIMDPPRSEAAESIARAKAAGIQVRMITGDHAVTAEAIGRQLGIQGRAITGAEFTAMTDEEATRQIDGVGVIARVAPEDKVHLVDILKKRGDIVAMTGDGVNDAPALKKADIGVAMGITGTEVSKEAAVMILTDDNFATIVNAVEQGRAIYDNLLRYIRFQMGTLFGFILTFIGAAIFNILGGTPFLPLQTLWVNFTVGVFQAVGLGFGRPTPGLMQRKPRAADEPILPRARLLQLAGMGLLMAIGTLAVIYGAQKASGDAVAHTMGLTTFSIFNLLFALETADERRSIFGSLILENTTLLKTTALSALAIVVATELRLFQAILKTTSLSLSQWGICLGVAFSIVIVAEAWKLILRRRPEKQPEAAQPVPLMPAAQKG
jgi:P-type Ca2+ transporter type 2C